MIQLLERFYSYVQNTPDKTAIVDNGGERATSYKELDDMSGRIASWLIKQGIGREDVVAIRVPRGVQFVAVRLAAMKTGTAWVGVEEMMGEERIAYIIKDSRAALVMDEENFEKAMGEEPLPADRWADPDLHDMAFIFYTSGSTGRPKGVVQEYGIYRNIVSSTYRSIDGYMPLNYANIAPETFIGGLYLMAGILSTGNTLHLIPLTLVRDPAGLLAYFKKHEIHATCMPPTLVKALEAAGGMDLRVLHITGEIAVDLYIDRFPVMNAYGPTEFSYLPFFFDLDRAYKNTPIGTPDEDTSLVLLDEDGSVNPKEGALCMHLPYFRGYLHDDDRADFVDIDGVTYFRNGDYLSVDERGNYTLLGRIDDMVKINGNRIEPAEVEFAVRKVLDTDFAAVKVWERGGSRYLCAYHRTGRSLDAAEMAEKLKDMLPVYMIPSCYVSIDTIPLNENGKVDKMALPEPDESILYATYAAPENDTQKKLCEIYAKVLHAGDHRIGIDDDFFLLGGDSLSAIRVVADAGIAELSVTMIYRERTVRNIDRALRDSHSAGETRDDERPYPLTD
ncbi:MAG: non-ribosomal peptide synthetase, partial [Lachnospiraceae bacterium]|nr:non-ribosomal peptide synthetase [Lachnospiraceae bacterium]